MFDLSLIFFHNGIYTFKDVCDLYLVYASISGRHLEIRPFIHLHMARKSCIHSVCAITKRDLKPIQFYMYQYHQQFLWMFASKSVFKQPTYEKKKYNFFRRLPFSFVLHSAS